MYTLSLKRGYKKEEIGKRKRECSYDVNDRVMCNVFVNLSSGFAYDDVNDISESHL